MMRLDVNSRVKNCIILQQMLLNEVKKYWPINSLQEINVISTNMLETFLKNLNN